MRGVDHCAPTCIVRNVVRRLGTGGRTACLNREIASQVGVTPQNVETIRKRCVLEGLEAALGRRKRSHWRATVLDGEGETQLIAIACSDPPTGRARWTLHLLADG